MKLNKSFPDPKYVSGLPASPPPSYRGHFPSDSLRDESLGETSYTFLLGTPGPWENVKLILLGIFLGTGP